MPKRFFELQDDLYIPGRWHLDNPTDGAGHELADDWQFVYGRPIDVEGRLKIRIEHAGTALDFTLTGLAVPVVHSKVASIFTKLAPNDVQLIPVDVGVEWWEIALVVSEDIKSALERIGATGVKFEEV